MFVNAIPTICAAFLAVMFVPESPRFFLSRGRLRDSVDAANMIVKRIGRDGQQHDLLTVEELRRYLFRAKQIGVTSFRAKEITMENEDNLHRHEYGTLYEEIRVSLVSMTQVFTNRMYRITIPLQLTYACLTLVTGESSCITFVALQNITPSMNLPPNITLRRGHLVDQNISGSRTYLRCLRAQFLPHFSPNTRYDVGIESHRHRG